MIRRPPRSTQSRSSAASDVYKRQPIAEQPVHVCEKHKGHRYQGQASVLQGEPGSQFFHEQGVVNGVQHHHEGDYGEDPRVVETRDTGQKPGKYRIMVLLLFECLHEEEEDERGEGKGGEYSEMSNRR